MIWGVLVVLVIFIVLFICSVPTNKIEKPQRLKPKCKLPKDIK